MTHPDLGDDTELSRRARRQSKKQERVRHVTTITAMVLLALGFGLFATETVRFGGGDGPTFAGAVRAQAPSTTLAPTTTTLPVRKCRAPLTDADPLRVWVGGDSLAGSLGPALGTIAGATGVVQPYFDSRVSSGLTNPTFFNWPTHAEKEMARLNPEIVVFIIGANDYLAPTTSTTTTSTTVDPAAPVDASATTVPPPADPWKVDYAARLDAMLTSLRAPDRTVIWVGPPPFKNEHDNIAIQQISELSRAVIAMHPDAIFVDDYSMFLDVNGKYTDRLPDANGNLVSVRSGDGVHFTADGGNQLARAVFGVIDVQCKVTEQAVAGVIKPTIQTEGSTLVAPGSGNRQGGTVSDHASRDVTAEHDTVGNDASEHHTAGRDDTGDVAAHDDRARADTPHHHLPGTLTSGAGAAQAVGRLPPMPDQLVAAAAAVDRAAEIVDAATRTLAHASSDGGRISVEKLDMHQVLAYDLAHAASAVEGCRVMLTYGEHGELESMLARAFIAEAIADLGAKVIGRDALWGIDLDTLSDAFPFVEAHRSPQFLEAVAVTLPESGTGPRHLSDEFELAADTFRRFAADKIRPVAEHVHRTNSDIPEDVMAGLAELGGFGLSVPEEHGGFASGGESDYLAMVVATEELSWGSLGVGGSLITRPEILTRAIVAGGTEEQKQRWLPRIASGELLVAVSVTEPDVGSDVAGVTTMATAVDGGYRINGVKTWATFAGRAELVMLLAGALTPIVPPRTGGLSLFVVEKDAVPGHSFALEQDGGGKVEGRAIDTIGYRGMHSFEVSYDDWFVPAENLVGEEAGRGRGFYLQMEGFENGRLQTAARAVGLMQAAFDAGLTYAQERVVFGRPVFDYQLSQAKLARMAASIQAGRQFSYDVAARMGRGEGTLAASMVKAYVCRAAEWVTREAMQLHGGMGYAEEFPVSRYFVDARVLSIFEGADETLCLRVIARRLAEQAL